MVTEMERIARFEKISRRLFINEILHLFGKSLKIDEVKVRELYEGITMPVRATSGSAGYDIFSPLDISLAPGESLMIPTGVRVKMREDYCFFILPKSGLGSRYRFQLNNTIGLIDSDYYSSDNEGHILVPMINDSRDGKNLHLKAGSAFAQGVFVKYGITDDDETFKERNGGFGSTLS